MKFVNLDESEIIEQPLEKVIARPDYSPIEFGYDNLCSLDSVSVDGIHPSGDDSDLILPPSINKINNCFKSEYFKISNLFSEIQTYEQKQQALKNLGILDAINDSNYIYNLGKFDKTIDAEKEAIKIANNSNIAMILYYVGDQNGVILQQVSDTITKQILLWDNTIFQRHVNFSDSSKTQVSSTSSWWKLGATHISYDPDTRKFHLQDMNYKNLNPTVDSQVPLASLTTDGFMSKEQAQKLETSLSIKDLGTNIRPHVATGNIITYVKDNDIKEPVLFKYIDTDNSSTLGICISRVNNYGWIIYLINRKGMERLVFNSNGVREAWNEYGGVLRHDLDSVTNEQLECLSVKGLKSVLSTKQDALSPGDGITMMNNTVSTLIGSGLTYNGREIVINHDLTLKMTNGKLGVNAGKGLYVNPDNELGINVGKGLAINHTDSIVEVAEEVLNDIDTLEQKVKELDIELNNKIESEPEFKDGLDVVGSVVSVNVGEDTTSNKNFLDMEDDSDGNKALAVRSIDTDSTVTTNRILVAGGPLDSTALRDILPQDESGNAYIEAGTDVQSLLLSLFTKVEWPTPTVTEGKINTTIAAPSFTLDKSGTVEVGTVATLGDATLSEVVNQTTGRTISTFTYGYATAVDGAITKNTSITIAATNVGVNSDNYTMTRDFTGFANADDSATPSTTASDVKLDGTTCTVVEGTNKVKVTVTGPKGTCQFAEAPQYYVASNVGTLSDEHMSPSKALATVNEDTTPSNSKELSVTGSYKYFLGYSDNTTYDQFDSASVRALTTKSGWITKDGTTTIVNATAIKSNGKSIVVACPSKYKLATINNGVGADILANFSSVGEVDVTTGSITTKYKVYVYPITNGAEVEFKNVTLTKA